MIVTAKMDIGRLAIIIPDKINSIAPLAICLVEQTCANSQRSFDLIDDSVR